MSQFLSQTNINILENFILTNKPISSDFLPSISECFREQAIKYWKIINESETLPTTYLQFADSAYGMTSYGFYKTEDGRIFLINLFCNKIVTYYNVVPTWNILILRDEFIKKQNDALLYTNDTETIKYSRA